MSKLLSVKFGKHKGLPYTAVPRDYAEWMSRQGKRRFYETWLKESRYLWIPDIVSRYQCRHTSPDGKWLSCKLNDGNYVCYIRTHKGPHLYYLVDSSGHYLRDLKTIKEVGAIDDTQTDWVTLTPNGTKLKGKMLVSPDWGAFFPYETYPIKAKRLTDES